MEKRWISCSEKHLPCFTTLLTLMPHIKKSQNLHNRHSYRVPRWDTFIQKVCPQHIGPKKESNFLLISQDGAVTMFHQDFSSTSVLYILLKGCKTFFLIAPTSINQDLFNQFLQQSRRKFFFGSHEGLNMGECQAITLKARQGLIMPANMIHMVETTGVSVAYGVNFIFKNHIRLAADTFKTERVQKTKFTECYPSFSFLALTHFVSRVH